MTPVYRTLEDGTRVYQGGMKYRPIPEGERKYKKHKPDEEGWIRIGNNWFPPMPLIPDEERILPITRGKDSTKIIRIRRREARLEKEAAKQRLSDT